MAIPENLEPHIVQVDKWQSVTFAWIEEEKRLDCL